MFGATASIGNWGEYKDVDFSGFRLTTFFIFVTGRLSWSHVPLKRGHDLKKYSILIKRKRAVKILNIFIYKNTWKYKK